MLPRHMDYIAAIVPSIISYRDEEGKKHLVAVNEGTLTKCGHDIRNNFVQHTLYEVIRLDKLLKEYPDFPVLDLRKSLFNAKEREIIYQKRDTLV